MASNLRATKLSIPEDVLRDLQERLAEFGYHGEDHADFTTRSEWWIRISTEPASHDNERTRMFNRVADIARKHGWSVTGYHFGKNDAIQLRPEKEMADDGR